MLPVYKKIQESYIYGDYPVMADSEGQFYCRAVHKILSDKYDQRVCGRGCPCYAGENDKGEVVCRYGALGEVKNLTPQECLDKTEKEIREGRVSLFPAVKGLSPFLTKAYEYAAIAHKNQKRKGTDVPYLTHIITTLNYAMQLTDDEEILAAAILHDTVEDTWLTIDAIRQELGDNVAAYVYAESENKREDRPASDTWEIRKKETIEHLKTASYDVKIIVLSDKTANAESLVREWRQVGDEIWLKFNQSDKSKQEWYYRSCEKALKEFSDTDVMKCYQKYMGELFG